MPQRAGSLDKSFTGYTKEKKNINVSICYNDYLDCPVDPCRYIAKTTETVGLLHSGSCRSPMASAVVCSVLMGQRSAALPV